MTPLGKGDLAELTGMVKGIEVAMEKDRQDVTVKLADVANKAVTVENYVKEVEARVAKAEKAGAASGGMSELSPIRSVIPQRMRKALEMYGRTTIKTERAVRMCALESWLKNSIWLHNPAVAARVGGALLDEMEKIERAFGFEPVATAQKAVLGEASGAEGGYLVPVPLEAEVLRQIEDSSVMRQLVRVFPMVTPEHLFPDLATNVVVSIVPQATTIPQSVPAFGQRVLKARQFAVRAIVDAFLVSDAAIGIISLVMELMSEKYGLKEDQQVLEGTGASEEFLGAGSAAGVNEITNGTNGDTFKPEKALDQKWAARKMSTRRGAAWIAAPEILRQIEGYRYDAITAGDKLGGWMYVPSQGLGAIVGTGLVPEGNLHGFPILGHSEIKVDRVVGSATNCSNMYFGPWKSSIILGDLLGLQFGVSEHTQWATNQLDLRMIKRTAALVSLPANITKQTGLKIA